MKKIIVLAVAVCLAVSVAIPAMAVDVDFSGYYRVRGLWLSNMNLNDKAETSDAYYDNRFRLQTVFTANDYVSVTTRFDVFDDLLWGQQVSQENYNPITWERVHMDIKTDFGLFTIGHQQAGLWGQDFFDKDYNDDRIKFTTKIEDVIVGAIIQKTGEYDGGVSNESDADMDVYYLFGIYKQENIEAGLLAAWARKGAPTAGTGTMNKQALLPYWKLSFGDIGVRGEIVYEMGEYEKYGYLTDAKGNHYDRDISALSYALEGSFSLDMAKLYAGYVFVSGQEQNDPKTMAETGKAFSTDMTQGNTAYGGIGKDFRPLAILTDDLGGQVLNSGSGKKYGVNMLYMGADVTVSDELTVHGILGYALADQEWTGTWIDKEGKNRTYGFGDDYGMEINVGVTYQIMDNLEYSATAAYLMTGDLLGYENGTRAMDSAFYAEKTKFRWIDNTDNTWGFIHQIKAGF